MVKAAVRRYWSALLLLAASAAPAQQYVISTLAGGVPPANAASATGVSIGQPNRVAVDGAGNVYFSSLNSVFKLSANGSLALVAGNSRAGFSGDGGPAVNAQLNSPRGLAVDKSNNLYIAARYARLVRPPRVREVIFPMIEEEYQRSVPAYLPFLR